MAAAIGEDLLGVVSCSSSSRRRRLAWSMRELMHSLLPPPPPLTTTTTPTGVGGLPVLSQYPFAALQAAYPGGLPSALSAIPGFRPPGAMTPLNPQLGE